MINTIICAIIFVVEVGIFYFLHRNNKVYKFLTRLMEMAEKSAINRSTNNEYWKLPWDIFNKHSYESMLFSFKPLTLEAWFTDEEIKILKGDEQ